MKRANPVWAAHRGRSRSATSRTRRFSTSTELVLRYCSSMALDTTMPPSQSEEVFVGLRRLGREAIYIKYEGEGHSQRYWGHANASDYLNRVLDWFERHLAPPHGDG